MSLPLPEPLTQDKVRLQRFLYPRSKYYTELESWESGGVAVQDPSKGLLSDFWHLKVVNGRFMLSKEIDRDNETVPVEVLFDINTSEVDFTFDQSMRLCICYLSDGDTYLYYYDTVSGGYTTRKFEGVSNPRVSLDDKRDFNLINSDILFAYIRDGSLYYRQQRERYDVEHLLGKVPKNGFLRKIGMCTDNRFRFNVIYTD